MDVIFVVGRVLLALMFIVGGALFHLGQRAVATEAARDLGVPLAGVGVPLTGIGNVVGGLLVTVGFWGDLGALVLAVDVLLFAIFMHPFWKAEGAARDDDTQHFMKNLTICGGLLVLFWAFNQAGAEAPLTLGDAFFAPL